LSAILANERVRPFRINGGELSTILAFCTLHRMHSEEQPETLTAIVNLAEIMYMQGEYAALGGYRNRCWIPAVGC
jgi:hypothetical protein